MVSSLTDCYYYEAFDLNNLPQPNIPCTSSTTNTTTTEKLLSNTIYDISNKPIGLANLICYIVYNKYYYTYVYGVEIDLIIDAVKLNYNYYLDYQLSSNPDNSASFTPFKYNFSIDNKPITNIKNSIYKYYYDNKNSSNNYIIEAFYIEY